jgi:hypothetical protein
MQVSREDRFQFRNFKSHSDHSERKLDLAGDILLGQPASGMREMVFALLREHFESDSLPIDREPVFVSIFVSPEGDPPYLYGHWFLLHI